MKKTILTILFGGIMFLAITGCGNKENNLNITAKEVNDYIITYFQNGNKNDSYSYNYIDEEKKIVIVGIMDISQEKQNEFINDIFTNCCGSNYIQYIKDNNMIEFRESIDIFDGKTIDSHEDDMTVEVLKDSKAFKKGDKVIVKITSPNDGADDLYIKGNNVRITFNGHVLTSDPAQVSATKIELITK